MSHEIPVMTEAEAEGWAILQQIIDELDQLPPLKSQDEGRAE